MNVKLTKNINEANCITHSGTFHADEIFATLILSKILPEIILIRVQEVREVPNENILVYDIGAGKYDHHQFGGNGQRENGIKYAACGLIWKAFGKRLLEKYDVEDIEYTWNYIDKNLIQFIDSNDNGQLPKLQVDYRNVHISYIISLFNPKWDETSDSDENFFKVLKLANIIFDEFLEDTFAKMKEAKQINYVVFPSNRGGYNVYAVPLEIGSFENRKTLPQSWRGKRDKELQEITGVKTARFCHNAGFLCCSETMEDAITLAYKAI